LFTHEPEIVPASASPGVMQIQPPIAAPLALAEHIEHSLRVVTRGRGKGQGYTGVSASKRMMSGATGSSDTTSLWSVTPEWSSPFFILRPNPQKEIKHSRRHEGQPAEHGCQPVLAKGKGDPGADGRKQREERIRPVWKNCREQPLRKRHGGCHLSYFLYPSQCSTSTLG